MNVGDLVIRKRDKAFLRIERLWTLPEGYTVLDCRVLDTDKLVALLAESVQPIK